MILESTEQIIFLLALMLSTINIYIYSWFQAHEKHLATGMWVIRATIVFPALLIQIWAIYSMMTMPDSSQGITLVTAGLLVAAGAIQTLSLLHQKLIQTA